jgi:hypothetical protein
VNKIGFAMLFASGLLADVIESGPAAAPGVVGIGLIAASATPPLPALFEAALTALSVRPVAEASD